MQKAVEASTDLAQLDTWFDRAIVVSGIVVSAAEELFAGEPAGPAAPQPPTRGAAVTPPGTPDS